MVLLIAAAAAAAAGGAIYAAVHHEPAPPPPSPQPTPTPEPSTPEQPVVPDLVAAATWREKAVAACKAEQWRDCLTDLDHARALDPDGDDTPEVKATRMKAIEGITRKRNP